MLQSLAYQYIYLNSSKSFNTDKYIIVIKHKHVTTKKAAVSDLIRFAFSTFYFKIWNVMLSTSIGITTADKGMFKAWGIQIQNHTKCRYTDTESYQVQTIFGDFQQQITSRQSSVICNNNKLCQLSFLITTRVKINGKFRISSNVWENWSSKASANLRSETD